MSKNKILIFIGSCGRSWPYNTTPIQRALVLKDLFDHVLFIDKEEYLSDFLCNNSTYIKVSSYNELAMVLPKYFLDRNSLLTVIHGPSWPISKEILNLRKKYNFKWIVDLYDHENLTSNIYFHKKNYIKFIYHRFFEKNIIKAIKKSDILISAIYENRFLFHKNRIKCINGVSFSTIKNAIEKSSFRENIVLEQDYLHLGYVGVLSFERSLLILKIIRELFERSNIEARVKFHLIGEFDEDFRIELEKYNSDILRICFYGFIDWYKVISILNNVDVCIYTFPIEHREELDCVYPIKIGEYFALGKHILSVESNGLKDILNLINYKGDIILIDENKIDLWIIEIYQKVKIKKNNNNAEISSLLNKTLANNLLDWNVLHKDIIESLIK